MTDTENNPEGTESPLVSALLAAVGGTVGAVLAFPAAIGWNFEWHAEYPGQVCWSLWLMMAAGTVGGVLWALAGRTPGSKWPLRFLSSSFILGPAVALVASILAWSALRM
ncbi:MAG TPA: hypothetical protein VE153_01685 [Myxococcus sp.]|jgi:hypothetical protein|nr:hypothetical protein [Myxococcus sp.]